MPIPLLLAALAMGQEPAATVATPPPFQTALVVPELRRLALTPKLDGEISPEEWDPFAVEPIKSYFQWEPGQLHAAAVVAAGQDLVLSFDLDGNGWLVGKDNLEVRVKSTEGGAKVSGRILDATNPAGPAWVDLPGIALAASAVARTTEAGTTYEVTLRDPDLDIFPTEAGKPLPLRIDAVAADAGDVPTFLPRVLNAVTVEFRRAAAAPSALKWNADGSGAAVLPGSNLKVRFTFNGTNELGLRRLSLRSEGFLQDDASRVSVPFPSFDRKKRAFVDYTTPVAKNASAGWRVVRGELTSGDGLTALLQASFRVAPTIDLELVREKVKSSVQDQRVRFTYYVRSNSSRRLDGRLSATLPKELRAIGDTDRKFVLYGTGGYVRGLLDLFVPAGTKGAFPINFRIEVGSEVFNRTLYLNVR